MGGDELNHVIKGKNYGWPKVSYGLWYNPTLKLTGGDKEGTCPVYTKPVFSWNPSVAPSSLIKIEGKKFKYWNGDLIMGTMRDQSLHRLRLDQDKRVVYDERIYLGHRIRDLTTLSDGKLALITDDGYLYIIDDGGPIFQDINSNTKQRMASLNEYDRLIMGNNTNLTKTKTAFIEPSSMNIFQQKCAPCHNLDPVNHVGPNLHNLFSREIGTAHDFMYSSTLKNDTRKWNPKLLKLFLKDPKDKFPNIKMQKINLTSIEVDSLIHLFQQQNLSK